MSETSTDIPSTDAASADSPAAPDRLPRPRIRTGAVLWGLVLVAVSATVLWIAVDPRRRGTAVDTAEALDGFGWTIVAVVAVGGILTLVAAAAVIRQVQRSLARRG